MSLDMFLQHQSVGVALLADETLVECPHWGSDLMDAHVSLEVSLGGETSLTDLTLVRPLPSVSPVVHLQGRLAGQNFVADDALVGVGQLVAQLVDEVLQLAGLALLVDLDEVLPLLAAVLRHLGRREHVGQQAGLGREGEARHELRPEQTVGHLGEGEERPQTGVYDL